MYKNNKNKKKTEIWSYVASVQVLLDLPGGVRYILSPKNYHGQY